jgi:hypothetical protein
MAYAATSLAMQDPWSVIAQKATLPKMEFASGGAKKRTIMTSDDGPKKKGKSKKAEAPPLLNKWELLPPSEAQWMRGLLEIPGDSMLTLLPCIKDEKIMPTEVSIILNSGRGKIIFYANVVHVTLCPRFLVNGNAIHKHHNDSAVAICITETMGGGTEVHRLFVRCFSEKCMHLCRKSAKQIPSKWEEYKPSHFIRYTRLLHGSHNTDAESMKAT